ncbi:putative lipid II flippase FtsW [Megalodesulfovibrio paquesii]
MSSVRIAMNASGPPAPPRMMKTAGSGGSSFDADWLGRMDFLLLGLTLLLTLFGLVMVLSASGVMASRQFGGAYHFFIRQCIFAVVGLGIMSFLAAVPLQKIYNMTYPMLLATTILLLAVIASPLGVTANGATRWIKLGFFNFQPMEMAKITLVLYLAWFFSEKQDMVGRFWVGVVPPFFVTGVFAGLTLLQPDFGGAAMMTMLLFLLCLVGGTRFVFLGGSVALAGMAGWLLIVNSPYRWKRFTAFLDPFADARDTGYQLVQSMYAFGSGGPLGAGLGASKQKLFFLPEAHNDFIMAVVGEELGFAGVTAVFIFMGLLCWRAFHIAMTLENLRDRLTAYGLTLIITLGAVLNMAVVLGAAPPKGVPMPFLSYGGSSLLGAMACVGLLLNLSRQPRGNRSLGGLGGGR